VIGRGRLIADTTVDDFIASNTVATVLVRSPGADGLAAALRSAGAAVTTRPDGRSWSRGWTPDASATRPSPPASALHELSPVQASLEEVFMELTSDMVDFHGQTPAEVGCDHHRRVARRPADVDHGRAGFVTQVRSEWTKLRSVRSTWCADHRGGGGYRLSAW